MYVNYYILQLIDWVSVYCLVTLNTSGTYYSVETKFNEFYSLLYLKKLEHFIILL